MKKRNQNEMRGEKQITLMAYAGSNQHFSANKATMKNIESSAIN